MSLFWSMTAMLGQLRRRRAYAPTSNTASQDNHEKINSWVSFIFPLHDEYGAPLGGTSGRRSSAIMGDAIFLRNPLTSSYFIGDVEDGTIENLDGFGY